MKSLLPKLFVKMYYVMQTKDLIVQTVTHLSSLAGDDPKPSQLDQKTSVDFNWFWIRHENSMGLLVVVKLLVYQGLQDGGSNFNWT